MDFDFSVVLAARVDFVGTKGISEEAKLLWSFTLEFLACLSLYLFILKYLFIDLAASGLGCSTWNLRPSFQHVLSFSCGM